MSRKRPSRHSEDQFALFLERIRTSLGSEDDAKFDEAVSNLIRQRKGGNGKNRNGSNDDRPSANQARPASQPEKPVAQGTAGNRQALMVRIGQLVVGWSNNERLLIHVLMLLLGTDERTAAAVHSTLGTIQARSELVRRLALLKVADPSIRQSLDAILDQIDNVHRASDAFLHDEHRLDERGETAQQEDQVDRLRLLQGDLGDASRTLLDILPRLRAALSAEKGDSRP